VYAHAQCRSRARHPGLRSRDLEVMAGRDGEVQRVQCLRDDLETAQPSTGRQIGRSLKWEPIKTPVFQVSQEQGRDPPGALLRNVALPDPAPKSREKLHLHQVAHGQIAVATHKRLRDLAEPLRPIEGAQHAGVEVDQTRSPRRPAMIVSLSGSPFTFSEARNAVKSGSRPGLRAGGTRRATAFPRRKITTSSPAATRLSKLLNCARASRTLTDFTLAPLPSMYTISVH
jgi:hypothetical protein